MRTPRFILLTLCATALVAPAAAQAGTLDQQSDGPFEGTLGIGAPAYSAQTFTAGLSGRLDEVQLHLALNNAPAGASFSVEIRAASLDTPSGGALASETRPASDLGTDSAWYSVALADPPLVVAGRQYAIVLRGPTTGHVVWSATFSSGPYTAGKFRVTSDDGLTWDDSSGDFFFRTFVANVAPVASGDSHTHFGSDTPLVVAAPGVLGDDTDDDGDTLTASLVSGAARGAVTLNADGSFRYQPSEDFVGIDSFTYKASDGQADSNTATVSITVGAGCNGKRATHVGTSRADHIVGTDGNDVIAGLAGDDRLFGKGGDDALCGGSGHDRLRGDGGTDSLDGGTHGADWLDGGTGNDRLEGDGGADVLFGGPGSDELDGGDGIDQCERAGGDKKRDRCEGSAARPVP